MVRGSDSAADERMVDLLNELTEAYAREDGAAIKALTGRVFDLPGPWDDETRAGFIKNAGFRAMGFDVSEVRGEDLPA